MPDGTAVRRTGRKAATKQAAAEARAAAEVRAAAERTATRELPRVAAELEDYLGLIAQPLAGLRMMVFHGRSGSGKSSQIKMLLERHRELAGRQVTIWSPPTFGRPRPRSLPSGTHDILVIDELLNGRDAACLGPALRSARLVLVASHVHPRALWPWRLRAGKNRCYDLDREWLKLARELDRRGVAWTLRSLRRFCAEFGANYTDLDIVLTQTGGTSLERALGMFLRGSAIRHEDGAG